MGLLDTPKLIKDWTERSSRKGAENPKIPKRNRALMVHPQHFKIAYAINPFMKEVDGSLKEVDSKKAQLQWKALVRTFENCGMEVEILDGQAKYPDMVFAANQSFPFWNFSKNGPEVILSNMMYEERKGEVPYFDSYFKSHEYSTHRFPTDVPFEGTGDAIIDPERKLIFCGFGFRTHPSVPAKLCELTGYAVIPLELKSQNFYHLDACFSLLNEKTAVIAEEAFSKEGLELLHSSFEKIIFTDKNEAKTKLAANCFSPNGRDVIVDEANPHLIEKLRNAAFKVQTVDTSEFLKAGGSVFCLKLFLW